MRFEKIIHAIENSNHTDWHHVTYFNEHPTVDCWYYKKELNPYPQNRTKLSAFLHTDLAIYKPDVNISLKWGMKYDGPDVWAPELFTNSPEFLAKHFLDIFYLGNLIERKYYITYISSIPLPLCQNKDAANFNDDDIRLFKLVHKISCCISTDSELDERYNQAFEDYLSSIIPLSEDN